MRRTLAAFTLILFCASCVHATAEVLIIADEFPAMEILAKRLKADDAKECKLVAQSDLPQALAPFEAVVVYIHGRLAEPAERACVEYAKAGGRLVLLHHSISSGKRQNREWFPLLGVDLRQGRLEQGGYKWIEDVTVEWVKLRDHYITTNRITYTESTAYPFAMESKLEPRPSFTLNETEVYLNHLFTSPRTILMGLKFKDASTGKTWMQDTAGWYRPAEKGWIIYFMPGHTGKDFEHPVYGQIAANAITAPLETLR